MKPLAHYQTLLERESNTIKDELLNIAVWNEETGMYEAIPEQAENAVTDFDETADRMEEFEERSARVATLGARLVDIENALEKITEATFGACEICRQPIEDERLDANPAARTCMTHMNHH